MHAAVEELVDEEVLRDDGEAEVGEEVRGKREDHDLAGAERADAVDGGLDEATAEAVSAEGRGDREGLDFDGGEVGGVGFGPDRPGDGADDLAGGVFGDEKTVDVGDDVAEGAGNEFAGMGLDLAEDGRGVGKAGGADGEGRGGVHGVERVAQRREMERKKGTGPRGTEGNAGGGREGKNAGEVKETVYSRNKERLGTAEAEKCQRGADGR